jgi:matrix metalloproteinase-27
MPAFQLLLKATAAFSAILNLSQVSLGHAIPAVTSTTSHDTSLYVPFCGFPQTYRVNATNHFTIPGEVEIPWKKQKLSYRINNFSTELGADKTKRIISDAFARWDALIPIEIYQVEIMTQEVHVDIEIEFRPRDFFPSDRILGRAFLPPEPTSSETEIELAGDVDFNTVRPWRESLFMHTALHEFGHALGLTHSMDQESVMFYMAPGDEEKLLRELQPDDVQRIQELYGKR